MDGAVKPAAAGGRRQQPGRPRAGLFPPRPAIAPPTGGQPLRPPRSERYSPRGGATLPRQRRHRPLGAPPTRGRLGAPWRRRADTRGHCGPGAGGGHGKAGLGKAFCHPHPPPPELRTSSISQPRRGRSGSTAAGPVCSSTAACRYQPGRQHT